MIKSLRNIKLDGSIFAGLMLIGIIAWLIIRR